MNDSPNPVAEGDPVRNNTRIHAEYLTAINRWCERTGLAYAQVVNLLVEGGLASPPPRLLLAAEEHSQGRRDHLRALRRLEQFDGPGEDVGEEAEEEASPFAPVAV